MKDKLIEKQREYIELLGKEINELGVPAYLHGWRSKRYEDGVKIRAEISALEKQIDKENKSFPIDEFKEYAQSLMTDRDHYSRAYIIEHLVDKVKSLINT